MIPDLLFRLKAQNFASATIDQVRKSVKGVEGASRALRDRMAPLNATMMRFTQMSLAASVAVGGGTAALTARSIAAARQIGILSAEARAAPEELSAMASAVRSVDMDVQKLVDILRDGQERIGEFAATGGGQMKDFFETIAPQVGLTADELARMSGPEALLAYVDALERAGVPQSQMVTYMEQFASDATRLLPILKDNGAELRRLTSEQTALNVALDSTEIGQLTAAGEAFRQLREVGEGVANSIALVVGPLFGKLALDIRGSAIESGGFDASITSAFENAIKFGSGFLDWVARPMMVVLTRLNAEGAMLGFGLTKALLATERFRGRITPEQYDSGVAAARREMEAFIEVSQGWQEPGLRPSEDFLKWVEDAREGWAETAERLEKLRAANEALKDSITVSPTSNSPTVLDPPDYSVPAMEGAAQKFFADLESMQKGFTASARSGIDDFLDGTRRGADGLVGLFEGVADRINEMLADAVFNPVAEVMGRMSMNAANSIFGGLGLPLVASANGNAFQGGRVVPHARGGIVDVPSLFPMATGQTGLMGEAGPEAILPLRRNGAGRLGVGAQPVDVRVEVDVRFDPDTLAAGVDKRVAVGSAGAARAAQMPGVQRRRPL